MVVVTTMVLDAMVPLGEDWAITLVWEIATRLGQDFQLIMATSAMRLIDTDGVEFQLTAPTDLDILIIQIRFSQLIMPMA